jgi:GxxExxY protein
MNNQLGRIMMPETITSANSAPLRETFSTPLRENDITGIIIDVAMDIHRRLGPGLLESVYTAVLAHELRKRGLYVAVEVPIPVEWDNIHLEVVFRADLIVEGAVIVELKSVESVAPVHKKQLLTYLRLANKRVGLLINFGTELLKDGIHRVVNNLPEESGSHAEARRSQRKRQIR